MMNNEKMITAILYQNEAEKQAAWRKYIADTIAYAAQKTETRAMKR